MSDTGKEHQKAIVKEAIQEWLDKKFTEFGKWSLRGIVAMALGAAFYIWLGSHGWHP